jgi:hypothetical protein
LVQLLELNRLQVEPVGAKRRIRVEFMTDESYSRFDPRLGVRPAWPLRKKVDRGALRVVKHDGVRRIPRSELERAGLWPGARGRRTGRRRAS